MEILREPDIDPAPLAGKRIAIVGYGNQGRAQALNLRDAGFDVRVGLRDGSPSFERAAADGLAAVPLAAAVGEADLVMLLAPDEAMAGLYGSIEQHLKPGSALGFSHGLAFHFGFVRPRPDLDVFLVAPKGPGSALRSLYGEGKGMVALWAVAQDASGNARGIALAYGRAIGCARAGLIASSFAEECEADLFNEGAVVWGAVPELLVAGFDTLVEAGVAPEIAYMECVGELKLLAELIEARGITAELGAAIGGPQVIGDDVRARMRAVLATIRDGSFAATLKDEEASGYPRLREARRRARANAVEAARARLSGA
jgi:ketol-acid reductoisomerase